MDLRASEKVIFFSGEIFYSMITGCVAITVSISMAALIFQGRLTSFLGYGIGMVVCASFVMNLVLLIGSSYKGIIAAPQSASSVVLAVGLGSIYNKFIHSNGPHEIYLIVTSYVFFTSIIVGLILFLAGRFKLGILARFIPYPVIGGFLAGTGFLIIKAAISFVIGFAPKLSNISLLFSRQTFIKILPTLLLALLMFILSKTKYRRRRHKKRRLHPCNEPRNQRLDRRERTP